jgi:hypothetical protein
MVGKAALAAFAASALLLVGSQVAIAADGPFLKLVEVTVDSQQDVDLVTTKFDAAEYKRVNDDGTITLNVFTTADEEAALDLAFAALSPLAGPIVETIRPARYDALFPVEA